MTLEQQIAEALTNLIYRATRERGEYMPEDVAADMAPDIAAALRATADACCITIGEYQAAEAAGLAAMRSEA